MSTYYYLICIDCKEYVDGASKTYGGTGCHLCNSDSTLPPFLIKHCEHKLKSVNEYVMENYSNYYESTDEELRNWIKKND